MTQIPRKLGLCQLCLFFKIHRNGNILNIIQPNTIVKLTATDTSLLATYNDANILLIFNQLQITPLFIMRLKIQITMF